jgi:uncharacterized membrane protein YgdD (TMEM256/DUF423 family)
MKFERLFMVLGSLSGFMAVSAGAFAAHALRQKLAPNDAAVFETAARYEMYHALALLAVAWVAGRWPSAAVQFSGWMFVAGTVLFCGSLYALALTGVRWLGAITPFGGLAFLVGWLCLAWGAWSGRS